MKNSKILISSQELQRTLLEFISSSELNKFIDNSVYKDAHVKDAIVYGITLAAMQTCMCTPYLISDETSEEKIKELENQLRIRGNMLEATERKVEELYERLEKKDKGIDAIQVTYDALTKKD